MGVRKRKLNEGLFQPPPPGKRTPRAAGLDYRSLDINTADGEVLRGWWIEARARRRGHLLFFHGNGEDASDCIPDARLLTGIGFDVLLFDYRGYGPNQADPSEQGTYLDAEAARRYMLAQPRVDRKRIFYFGRSLGGAVALALAVKHRPAGLILLSTFTSARDMARAIARREMGLDYIPGAIVPNAYPSLKRIEDLRAPLLVLHGDADELVPLVQGARLYEAADRAKKRNMYVFRDRDHNDVMTRAGKELSEVVLAWHKSLPARKASSTR